MIKSTVRAAIRTLLLALPFIYLSNISSAQTQTRNRSGWGVKNPFTAELFIENKGQFDPLSSRFHNKPVLYAVENRDMHIYFGKSSFLYFIGKTEMKDNSEKAQKELKELLEKQEEKSGSGLNEAQLRKFYTDKSSYVNVEWLGSNPNATVEVQVPVQRYFTYAKAIGKDQYRGIKANAYKKLVYRDIYQNIDVEFYFPENKKGGIEYNIIVHPGGDLSQVKMKYSGHQGLSVDSDGNLLIQTLTEPLTDHSPVSFYESETGKKIKTSFSITGDVVSFQAGEYNKDQTLVVDPYVTSPVFTTGENSAYAVDVDYNGNAYIYGGLIITPGVINNYNYQVSKLDPSGNILWTYTTPQFISGFFGDIAVTRAGDVFICYGATTVQKLTTGGTLVTTLPQPNPNGSAFEVWQLSYNKLTNSTTLYIGGGLAQSRQMATVDLNLTPSSVQCYNSCGSTHTTKDIVYMAQERDESYVYGELACNSLVNGNPSDPEDWGIVKVPTSTMQPYVWRVRNPSVFIECHQMYFINNGTSQPVTSLRFHNSLNGMAVGCSYVYTFDGKVLSAWDKTTGAQTYSVNTPGTFNSLSGIYVDKWERVYVGQSGSVQRYSSTLVPDVSIPVTSDVYDLTMDPQSDTVLYVSGKGFTQKIDSILPGTTMPGGAIILTASNTSLCAGSSVTLTAAGGSGNYSWSNGSTGSSIVVTPTGTTGYTVTVLGCNPSSADTIINLYGSPGITWGTWAPTLSCDGYTFPFNVVTNNAVYTNWNFGDGTTWTSPTVTPPDSPANPDPHTYPFSNSYHLQVVAWNPPCSDTADTVIAINAVTFQMLPANVFTPNGDGRNDCFHPQMALSNLPANTKIDDAENSFALCVDMEIYDRWGVKMFSSTDNVKCWDGRTGSGKPAKEGTYYYVAKFKDITLKGYVELLR